MTTTRTTVVALVLPVVLLGGCASAPRARASKAEGDCVYTREINTISALDDRHVWVKAGANHHYLFTVEETCQDLMLARQIAFFEATTRVCGDGNSLLTFTTPTVGPMRCRVETVDSVRDKDAALELIAAEAPPR